MWKIVMTIVIVGIASFYIHSASKNHQRRAQEDAARNTDEQRERLDLHDPSKISKILSDRVRRTPNGWVLEKNGVLEETVLVSKIPPWQLNCGLLGIHLQSLKQAGDEDYAMDVEISSTSFGDDECSEIVPIIGGAVAQLFETP